ncbi:GNAT family N-acetyltransferase [Legionella feeleii]|nr:GNAT family N-acetyltransferase [Legionella feeleii]
MKIKIRKAKLSDVKTILLLVLKLAEYEKKTVGDVKLTTDKIIKHAFCSKLYFNLLVAETENELVGYALYFFTYAASLGAPILYLEDLFVLENYQRQGIGTKFLTQLAKIAANHHCCRMEWHTFSWNRSAIDFYQSMSAVLRPDLIQVRLQYDALQQLAIT